MLPHSPAFFKSCGTVTSPACVTLQVIDLSKAQETTRQQELRAKEAEYQVAAAQAQKVMLLLPIISVVLAKTKLYSVK